MENKLNRLKELDALRGIAAILVVFFHFTLHRTEAKLGFKLGTTGVDLFFIISGFVIFMSISKINQGKEFVINRLSRLYPTYWTCVTFTFILLTLTSIIKGRPIELLRYFGNMTMLQHFFNIENIDGPYWTMIIELIFYALMLLLFYLKQLNNIVHIGFMIMLTVTTLDFFRENYWVNDFFLMFPFFEFVPLFFSGIIFYKIYTQTLNNYLYYIIALICLACQLLMFNHSGRSHDFISQFEYSFMLVIYFFLFFLFVKGKLGLIVNKATLFMGKISFALYLIHQYFGIGIIKYSIQYFQLNFWFALSIALTIVISLSTIITFYVEIPLGKKMKKYLNKNFL